MPACFRPIYLSHARVLSSDLPQPWEECPVAQAYHSQTIYIPMPACFRPIYLSHARVLSSDLPQPWEECPVARFQTYVPYHDLFFLETGDCGGIFFLLCKFFL